MLILLDFIKHLMNRHISNTCYSTRMKMTCLNPLKAVHIFSGIAHVNIRIKFRSQRTLLLVGDILNADEIPGAIDRMCNKGRAGWIEFFGTLYNLQVAALSGFDARICFGIKRQFIGALFENCYSIWAGYVQCG